MDIAKRLATVVTHRRSYNYWDITSIDPQKVKALPYSLRVMLENILRSCGEGKTPWSTVEAFMEHANTDSAIEIPFYPARVLMQDFTGVPAVADLCALRDAMVEAKADPNAINPVIPVDLVIDHSVQIDAYGTSKAIEENVRLEYQRNTERYKLLKWAQGAFDNLRIVPPSSGICHQVNLEHLAPVTVENNGTIYCDSVVGTDSHTTMINGLGVMGWGVGGIEAEAAMLGQPYWMIIPKVVGFKLSGTLAAGCTATDVVLTVTEMLRKKGVVGCFVEFFGPALPNLTVADRATVANMSPEYGATMGFFPIDERTIEYLEHTGRKGQAELTEAFTKANMLFYDPTCEPHYNDVLSLDLSTVEPSIAGPSRPQDRITLSAAKATIGHLIDTNRCADVQINGVKKTIKDGAVAIAAITSCTNTSNPAVLISAALLARNACNKSLKVAPWVKTSFAPGSKVVEDYLSESELLGSLEQLGFNIAAFGCTTCIGNSGPLHPEVEKAHAQNNLLLSAALSGNRNFEGRIHQRVAASFLMSPPLVVAYALAGTMHIDFSTDPLGEDADGKPVYLADIWPDDREIIELMNKHVSAKAFSSRYADIFTGDELWKSLEIPQGNTYQWDKNSTYIARPPFVEGITSKLEDVSPISKARALLVMADSVTTDHISPAGSIDATYPAGVYLASKGIKKEDFNSYGSRRGNHEVMARGTFANIRIRQQLSAPQVGGFTRKLPEGTLLHVYDAAMAYMKENTATIILAGKEYGTGSSRDWAAKGPKLLGVRAVIAQSFERIHRSNLVGMGILPLVFAEGESYQSLKLDGHEQFTIALPQQWTIQQRLVIQAVKQDRSVIEFSAIARLDSETEIAYYLNGGILPFVLRSKLSQS